MIKVFHDTDADGFGSAFLLWEKYGDNAAYIPLPHGTGFDFASLIQGGDIAFVVDLALTEEQIDYLQQHCVESVIIDHHTTFPKEYHNRFLSVSGHSILHSLNKSACLLTWEYLFGSLISPEFVRYINDRDIWAHKLPFTKPVNARIASYPFDFRIWQQWTRRTLSTGAFVEEGHAILAFQRQQMAHASVSIIIEIAGICIPLVNSQTNVSEIGHQLSESHDGYGGCFHHLKDGKVKVSLRSKGEKDVATLCKMFGGGGHRNAAGFVVDWNTLNNLRVS